jgi:hypothetical protein
VRAVYVETDPAGTRKLEEKWAKWGLGVPLVVLMSPYGSLLRPFLDYNQTALLIKGALLFRKNTVVADVPYLLKR